MRWRYRNGDPVVGIEAPFQTPPRLTASAITQLSIREIRSLLGDRGRVWFWRGCPPRMIPAGQRPKGPQLAGAQAMILAGRRPSSAVFDVP